MLDLVWSICVTKSLVAVLVEARLDFHAPSVVKSVMAALTRYGGRAKMCQRALIATFTVPT